MKRAGAFEVLLAVGAAVALSGCPKPEQRVPDQGAFQAPLAGSSMNTVRIGDPYLASILSATSGGERVGTGTLRVWAEFENRGNENVAFEARTRFYDENGAPLGEDSSFQRVSVEKGGGIAMYETSSMTTKAKTYRIEVRVAR